MEEKFLTKKEMATKLQVTERSIDNWVKDGILTPVKGLPVMRFSQNYITKLEGVELTQFSPIERRKLLIELEEITKERDRLKNSLVKIQSMITEVLYKL